MRKGRRWVETRGQTSYRNFDWIRRDWLRRAVEGPAAFKIRVNMILIGDELSSQDVQREGSSITCGFVAWTPLGYKYGSRNKNFGGL